MNQIGINVFGLKELLHTDFEGTFHTLREIGFSAIEPMVVFPEANGMEPDRMEESLRTVGQDGAFWVSRMARQRIRWLREEGFAVHGAQLGLVGMVPGGLDAVLPQALRFSQACGLSSLVYSPQKKTIAQMHPDAQALRRGLELSRERGVELLFHCHYHEFSEDQGDTPFSYLLREVPQLRIELDVGWVQFAKQDVIALMEQYRERIAIVHLKDITPDASVDNIHHCFTAIGEGSLPLEGILRKAKELPLIHPGLIVDQDASRQDMLTDLRNGFCNIQKYV